MTSDSFPDQGTCSSATATADGYYYVIEDKTWSSISKQQIIDSLKSDNKKLKEKYEFLLNLQAEEDKEKVNEI